MSDVRYLSKKYIKEFIDLYRSLPSLWNLKSKEYYARPKKNADYEIMVNKLREMEWSNETVQLFIELYEEEPVIWNPKHPGHKNRNNVHDAWTRIKTKFCEGYHYIISVQELKKKKDNLMATYRKLNAKVKSRATTSSGTNTKVFKPNWPFYEQMAKFLLGVYKPTSPTTPINSEVEPEATREMVTQKINSLRSSRRKETAKIKQSIEAGGDLYVPKLWYYKLMDFLDGQETFKRKENDDKGSDNASSPQSEDDIDTGSVTVAFPRRPSLSSTNNSTQNRAPSEPHIISPVVAFRTQPSPKRQTSRKRKLAKIERKLAKEETKTVSHEAFGRYIAHKLENLPFKQRIYVEKIINDAIFEAELGNLNRNCYVHVPAVSDTE